MKVGSREIRCRYRLGELLEVEQVLGLESLADWERALSSVSISKLLKLFSIGSGLTEEEVANLEGVSLQEIVREVGEGLAEALGGKRSPFPKAK